MVRKTVLRLLDELRARILQKEVTVYDSYGYPDPDDSGRWIVPMRAWVHDNRDTPFVEEAIEAWAVRHFERDLDRRLDAGEKEQLLSGLANFIADDKSDESVQFTFARDKAQTRFEFSHQTTHNGVVEELVQVPDELVGDCLSRQAPGDRWLQVDAVTGDGHGRGSGKIRFLEPDGLSIVSDIDDTVKVTQVPAGKRTVLRNTFLKKFSAADGMRERYLEFVSGAGSGDTCFHYVSGSPWQLYRPLTRFLFEQEQFPPGTVHMKNLRKNLFDRGALRDIMAFALGGDLATLDQKIRQITNLMIHLPRRKFILVGDSGEKDPEVYHAIQRLFPDQVLKIYIRDVLGERLTGMELITGPDVAVALDTSELRTEMEGLIAKAMRVNGSTSL